MARLVKVSCELPVGVVIEGLRGAEMSASSFVDRFLQTGRLDSSSGSLRSRLESNQPLTLTLEVPAGKESETIAALRVLIEDLET